MVYRYSCSGSKAISAALRGTVMQTPKLLSAYAVVLLSPAWSAMLPLAGTGAFGNPELESGAVVFNTDTGLYSVTNQKR
jgi:hypothetical protein